MAAQRVNRVFPSQKNFSNPNKRDWKKEKMDKFCEHCKGRGHTMDQCFKLILPKRIEGMIVLVCNSTCTVPFDCLMHFNPSMFFLALILPQLVT